MSAILAFDLPGGTILLGTPHQETSSWPRQPRIVADGETDRRVNVPPAPAQSPWQRIVNRQPPLSPLDEDQVARIDDMSMRIL